MTTYKIRNTYIKYLLMIIRLLPLTFFLFTLFACEESTKPETVSFSGTVILEGKTDFSGVKVSLYRPVVLDTALVRINQQYPNIGVQISQETEFDHREHSASYSTTTNAGGAWKIEDITPGTYNVVAEKDSFGWQVEYEKQTGNAQFDLYKNILLTSMSNSTYTFESGRCYIISMDVYLQDMTTLNFEANSKIIFTTNNDLEINNSTLSFPSAGWVHITSDTGITNAKMTIEESNCSINGLKVTHMNKGLKLFNCSNGLLKNAYFSNNGNAFLPEFCSDLQVENILVKKNVEGLLPNSGNITITKSLFYNNNIGMENQSSNIQLTNSLFQENFIGATFMSSQSSRVEYCEFKRNDNSSINIIGNNLEVYYNNFLNDSSCSIYALHEYAGSGSSFPLINNNNFIGDNLAISQSVNQQYFGAAYGNRVDIDVKENYWGTNLEYEISLKIYDYYDNNILGKVDFAKYKHSKILNAGIE